MLPDLERLIQLQQLDTATDEARRTVDGIPSRIEDLDTRLRASTTAVDAAGTRLGDKRNKRRTLEKSLAEVQGRLSRFKEQLMAVKTNKEYTAVQHEIATAEAEVQRLEDAILEHMLEADDLDPCIREKVGEDLLQNWDNLRVLVRPQNRTRWINVSDVWSITSQDTRNYYPQLGRTSRQ
mgnify:CR=1 FL=1